MAISVHLSKGSNETAAYHEWSKTKRDPNDEGRETAHMWALTNQRSLTGVRGGDPPPGKTYMYIYIYMAHPWSIPNRGDPGDREPPQKILYYIDKWICVAV